MEKIIAGALILVMYTVCLYLRKKDEGFFCGSLSSLKVKRSGKNRGYKKITAKKAKKMMDELGKHIILDVRAPWEYEEGHVKGAFLMPDYEFPTKALGELSDMDCPIFLYCKSGRRSLVCAKWLIRKGYTRVYDFGSLDDWPYDTVKNEPGGSRDQPEQREK